MTIENEFTLLEKDTHALRVGIGYRWSDYDMAYDSLGSHDSYLMEMNQHGAFMSLTLAF